MHKFMVAIGAAVLAFVALFAFGQPALAQSAGYKFLESVEKRQGDEVEKALGVTGGKGTPGAVIINTQKIDTGDTALHIIIARRDLDWLQYFLSRGADPNLKNFKGTSPLWLAVNTGFIDGATVLIAKGARVNDPGPAGMTPLIAAVQRKDLRLVKALIDGGADPLRADSSGRTAIDYAGLAGNQQIADEVAAAVKAAKAKKAKSYGPSF